MTRTILSGLLAVISVATIALAPLACQSGGVGDPCTPEDEYDPSFSGFKVTEENIESRSFQCQTRICLVNHFQGRVSCPLGQQAPPSGASFGCTSDDVGKACTNAPGICTKAGTAAPDCDPNATGAVKAAQCAGYGGCDPKGKFCTCSTTAGCPTGFACDPLTKQCTSYACHTPNSCQTVDGSVAANTGKACCIPGTDTPVVGGVCGQCAANSKREAADAVYCSCRCGVADGDPDDPNFNFCTCPSGFECSEIRADVGISDPQITGKYCIKSGTAYPNDNGVSCSTVQGTFIDGTCDGIQGL